MSAMYLAFTDGKEVNCSRQQRIWSNSAFFRSLLDPQRWSRRTHPLWPHVLFLAAQDQSCFPSSRKSTSRKRSSRTEQSGGIQPHSRTPAHPVPSCSREIFPQRENPSGKRAQ